MAEVRGLIEYVVGPWLFGGPLWRLAKFRDEGSRAETSKKRKGVRVSKHHGPALKPTKAMNGHRQMLSAAPTQRVCTVSLRSAPGRPYFAHTTMASTVFEAVVRAKEFFELDFWKGPKPTPATVYRVCPVADEREFRVPAEALEKWERNRV